MADETAVRVMYRLVERGETLATAESLTGGLAGDLITAVPGSSGFYVGGVIAYATEVKQKLLGVSDETVEKHGVVSAECAAEMAAGARARTGATWAVSTTGVAGPDPQEDKPVGLVYVGVDGPRTAVRELRLEGDRGDIRRQACEQAFVALLETVNACPDD
ncbi:MAG TPA: CinA family protein [Nocardioidaceae bacterium]|nr:CinA family protein [Nocardioidaceae bacterium]